MNISAKLIKKFDDYYLLDIDLRNIAEAKPYRWFYSIPFHSTFFPNRTIQYIIKLKQTTTLYRLKKISSRDIIFTFWYTRFYCHENIHKNLNVDMRIYELLLCFIWHILDNPDLWIKYLSKLSCSVHNTSVGSFSTPYLMLTTEPMYFRLVENT